MSNPVPCLIEYPTSIWFCLLEDDKYIKVAEVAGGVTELEGYKPKSLKQVRDRDRQRPKLLCVGDLAEAVVQESGQWEALLRLMASRMQRAFPKSRLTKKQYMDRLLYNHGNPIW